MLNYLKPRTFEKDFFDDFFSPSFLRNNNTMMRTDISEKENEYLLEVELPGVSKEDVKLSLDDGYLKIEVSKSVENSHEDQKVIHRERYFGSQSRSYYVGNVDQNLISANFDNGILQISVPKEELVPEDTTKYIEIR